MPKTPHLSVVVPCYNEENNIGQDVLNKIDAFLQKKPYAWEVIIVDDGSTDRSREIIEKFIRNHPHFLLLSHSHQGKAKTVTTGVLQAKGKYILFTDFDQATPLSEVDKLLPYFDEFDIVIGSRKDIRQGSPFSRRLISRGFMMLRNMTLNLGIVDTQCGFKSFKRTVAQQLFKKLRLYKSRRNLSGSSVTAGFDVELLYLAKKMGFSIKEVPVVWKYVETRRVNPIRDSWDGLIDLARIKLNDLRDVYE